MCGRFAYYEKIDNVVEHYGIDTISDKDIEDMKNFNVAPTNKVPVVYEFEGKQTLKLMHFKMIPFFHKTQDDVKKKCKYTLNSKSETIFELASWRRPIKRSRCIIPMNNFYEFWSSEKRAFACYLNENQINSVAGIFDVNNDVYEEPYFSFAVVTIESSKAFYDIHTRQPIFLKADKYDKWLDRTVTEPAEISKLFNAHDLSYHEVDYAVGNIRNNDEHLIRAI